MDIASIDKQVYEKGPQHINTLFGVENITLDDIDPLFKDINKRLHETCDAREIVGCVTILQYLAAKFPKFMFGIRDLGHIEEEATVYGSQYIPQKLLIVFQNDIIFWDGSEYRKDERLKQMVKDLPQGVFMIQNIYYERQKLFAKVKIETTKAATIRNNNPFSALAIDDCFED